MRYRAQSVLVIVLGFTPGFAASVDESPKTVEQLHPNLASGVLTHAKVQNLPEEVLLEAGEIKIGLKDIDAFLYGQPEQLQPELKKNAFFILEQEATGRLLKKIAVKNLSENGKDVNSMADNQLLQTFFEELAKDVKVTDQDVETFYKENESIFCGTPLASVRKQIESYVLQDKKQRFVAQYVQTLGQRIDIFVSDSWTKQQATNANDNPLDKARDSGKPTLAIFSAASCCGPDKMIPVKEALLKKYDNKINVVYIEPRKEQILAARYGIRSVPTQILYDKTGKEYFRHSGYYSETDLIDRLVGMGVQ